MRIYNNGNYSPVRGRVKNDEEVLQGDLKTVTADRAEIERMLEERWPGKIEPIRHALPRKFRQK